MNEQNNNMNSSLNQQNQSVQNNSTQTTKPRFFSPELFEDSDPHSVGSSVSNNVSNRVISWGVGQKNTEPLSQENTIASSPSSNPYQEQLLEQVNGVIYTDEQPEILDDSFLDEVTPPAQYNIQNSPLFQEASANTNVSNPISPNVPSNLPPNSSISTPTPAPFPSGEDWMSQQPLSASSLGVGMENSGNEIKEVEEQNRFFQPNISNELQTSQEQQIQYSMQQGNGIVLEDPAPVIDEKQLVRDFVGPKYTKLSMSPFNFPAFLFGSCYYIYRKMYFFGILLCVVNAAILKFVSFPISSIATFVLAIVVGLATNPLYLKCAEKKVKKIVKKSKDKNQIVLSTLCKKKGGTSIFMFLLFVVVYSTIFSFLSYATIVPKVMEYFSSTSFLPNQKEKEQEEETPFDGNILYEEYAIEDTFTISIPSSFQKEEGKIYKYYYESESQEKYNRCTLTFSKVYGFSSSEEVIQKIASYEKVKENIGKTTTNGIDWDTLSVEGDYSHTHYRSTMVGEDVLLLQYDSGIHTPVGVCDTYFVSILESLTLKEE